MGSCISKCKPKKLYPNQDYTSPIVQDKLVISQQSLKSPKITPLILPSSKKISPSPPSPPSSSSSISSITCAKNTTTSSSTISSCSSSILASKDRSFSNEFLWSCVKENPHIVRINSIKEYSHLPVPPNVHVPKLNSLASISSKQLNAPKTQSSTPQKRARSNSPAPLNRQKSFRRESERTSSSYITNNSLHYCRSLQSSPSPSGRFNGASGRGIFTSTPKEICSKRMVNNNSCVSSSLRKQTLSNQTTILSTRNKKVGACLRSNIRNRETCIHRISSKIDEVAVEEAVSRHDPMEDIDNPLISLDCFIFL